MDIERLTPRIRIEYGKKLGSLLPCYPAPMDLAVAKQIKDLIEKRTTILILTATGQGALYRHYADGIGAGIALSHALTALGKRVTVAIPYPVASAPSYFVHQDILQSSIAIAKQFIIQLAMGATKIEEFSYAVEETTLNILITPRGGMFRKEDITAKEGAYTYDLVIVLRANTLEELGPMYDTNPEFFFETPVINIDTRTTNENFGTMNLIELTASSVAEVSTQLIEFLGVTQFDPEAATMLLTGIVLATDNFQNRATTPQSLAIASQLMTMGADQQAIVRFLYREKPLALLKLWGRILARLEYDTARRTAWSLLASDDFEKTQTTPEEIDELLDELLGSTPEADYVMIIYEYLGKVTAKFRALNAAIHEALARDLGATRTNGVLTLTETGKTVKEMLTELLTRLDTFRKEATTPHNPTEPTSDTPDELTIEEEV